VPLLVAGLPDVGRTGTEGEQAFQLGLLVPVNRVNVDVQAELSRSRFAAGAQDNSGLQAAESRVGGEAYAPGLVPADGVAFSELGQTAALRGAAGSRLREAFASPADLLN
jgi:hypothetical protein